MPYRNPLRGIHAPHTQQMRPVRIDEIGAIELMNAGSISILDYHLKDERFRTYLAFAASDGMRIYVRHMHGYHEVPDPQDLSERIQWAQEMNPWLYAHIIANEPNNEFPISDHGPMYWHDLNDWIIKVWELVDHAEQFGSAPLRLVYPPLAQDQPGYLSLTHAYNELRPTVELFIKTHNIFGWHDYWYAGDTERLIEHEFPMWLHDLLLDPKVETVISECGRKVDDPHGVENMADELTHRFGSAALQLKPRTLAKAVTPWILGSHDPAFGHQAFVDELGGRRQVLYDWAWWGP